MRSWLVIGNFTAQVFHEQSGWAIRAIACGLLTLGSAAWAPTTPVTSVNSQIQAPASARPVVVQSPPAHAAAGPLVAIRGATAGTKQRIDTYIALNPDCSPEESSVAAAIIKSPPAHGTFVTERGEDFPNFPRENQRFPCNLKRSPAVLAYYTAAPGYNGTDTVLVDVIFPRGETRVIEYRITVLDGH